ncbi:MAG TPA: tRNA uridine-5-carboxymethylaminomethyl(34) synthesis GTPase MnmE [Gammaproteobacteria bacterium]|nr:tRNA uridine-5-carboxymethylaminomethyl(34) synthesis GTPase MnmE [Gammaproteobacteria bacterium]MCH77880.1 tRNA uridine-5-carboxymethylaminomethyl(34) synthesis GTPase MnmE [Gammaproteobacteria bacterium]
MSVPADTIAAIATPHGRGGVGMVRISGPAAATICRTLTGRLPPPRQAQLATFRDAGGEAIDHGLCLYFPAPRSFTGEDVVELHGHGGPVVMDLLLARVLALGARQAAPGEFSQRAFLNDKLDLAQAEAVADLIDAASASAARAALRSLDGAFSHTVRALTERLISLRVQIEAGLDFPDEELELDADGALTRAADALARELEALVARAGEGRLLREGLTVVLAGAPNVGKSSLLNALAEREAAIVTAIAGTTRDVLREYLAIDGLPLHLIDTAGLRDSTDPVEQEGVRRARAEIAGADHLLFVTEAGDPPPPPADLLAQAAAVTRVINKIDLTGGAPRREAGAGWTDIHLSARSGAGLDLLRQHLKTTAGYGGGEGLFSARRRHVEALPAAAGATARAAGLLAGGAELAAEELRQAQRALDEITGEFGSDDLLGRIFSTFCIGK